MSWFEKLLRILFFIGVFFIPFNSFEGWGFLGEFRNESAVFFFLSGAILLFTGFVLGKRFTLPLKNFYFQLALIFMIWCAIATILNLHTVVFNYFKHTGGVNRFFRQYISLIFSGIVLFAFYWHVLRKMTVKQILIYIRRIFLASLIVASVYGFLETLIIYFKVDSVRPILMLFNYFPFVEVKVIGDRISSIAQESPYLAIYLITIAGWMFSYILTAKGVIKFIPTFLVLLLTFFSGSRTGLVVIFAQIMVFLVILFFNERFRKYVYIFVGTVTVAMTAIVAVNSEKVIAEVQKKIESLDFKSNLTDNVSNKSRLGIQYANLQVFKEHPIVGVGFGQQAYHNRFHYPIWSTYNNYEFTLVYKDQQLRSFPPGYNVYIRILTETGIIGMAIFLVFLISLLLRCRKLVLNSLGDKKILAIILMVSFVGILINWLQIDSFRLYGFWIYLAIFIHLLNPELDEKNKKINNQETEALRED